MLLDELALRRSTFQADSVPVVLADGRPWYLPRPYVVDLVPRYEGGVLKTVGSETQFGPEYDHLVDDLFTAEGVKYARYFALAALLLRHNYDLADAALAALLRHRRDDEASLERMQAVLDVALGNAPKAHAAGDGSPA